MQVAQYLFQSPSTSPVQVGKLDPSSKEETVSAKVEQGVPVQAKTAGEIMTGKSVEIPVVTPRVQTDRLLDVYA